jgi:hypothetical protein
MTPEQRLRKAFELSALAQRAWLVGLRRQFPAAGAEEFRLIVKRKLEEEAQRELLISLRMRT